MNKIILALDTTNLEEALSITKKINLVPCYMSYEQFNQYNLTFKHRNLDNTKIKYLKNYGYKRFYFRIKNLPLIFRSCLSLIR